MGVLSVWFNGMDWVIATDINDAQLILFDHYGDLTKDDLDYEGWHRLDDDKTFTMIDPGHDWLSQRGRVNIPGIAEVSATAPASEWIRHRGRGWLASTEW